MLLHYSTSATKISIEKKVQCCFSKKNGEQRYQYLVISRDKSYFMERNSKSNRKYKHGEIIEMLDIAYRHIYPVRWTSVSADDMYSDGYKLFPTTTF